MKSAGPTESPGRDFAQPALAAPTFTGEQVTAIERREGDLLLDAGAGSGKTAVLVERFVRAVREDGIEVGQILAITFTDKAAAELKDRIRERLRELGDDERARATEGAWISTIHGFCARVLRAGALAAGIDPAFTVLDETEAGRLAALAFERALEEAVPDPDAVDLVAGYRVGRLRPAIITVHDELRSHGERAPALPPLPPVPASAEGDARRALAAAHAAAVSELVALPANGGAVADALARLERCAAVLAAANPWLADIDAARLRNGSAAALSGEACGRYRDALEAFRGACARREAGRAHRLLDRLLRAYGVRYAELKRERSALDFEDLELLTRDLLAGHREFRGRYAQRFAQIMVDELQDTNPVQLELIESIARENLFTVGDAFQSIYGFRHADVELFEARRERLGAIGAHATLTANFRSRPELLDALNIAFKPTFGERFTPLRAGRVGAAAAGPARVEAAGGGAPAVELIIVDKAAGWGPSAGELSATWRLAEARALAARVAELVRAGAAPRDVVLLARATTDLRVYERALEDRGVPTYVVGGRGYWSHPQVIDLVAHLCALANPRDGHAFHTVLASPLVGVSADALVVLAAAGRESRRDPWSVIREPGTLLDDLGAEDRERLSAFAAWFSAERDLAPRLGIEELIERALELTGYDLRMLAMPGGERRLANVRKLMRLGREHESRNGRDLRGFLDLVYGLTTGSMAEARESEAPVEGEALDAVRLMTIHRAKGLEFEIVCVADLGRTPRGRGGDLLRVGRDGRLGLRVARAGRGRLIGVLDYDTVGVAREQAEEREERRLYYVAMTRARERLVLSGAVTCGPWPDLRRAGAPLAWIAPAFVPDIAARAAAGELAGVLERAEGEWRARVAYTVVRPSVDARAGGGDDPPRLVEAAVLGPPPAPVPAAPPAPPVPSLSYTSLGEYGRCGYRFYLERVLRLPRIEHPARAGGAAAGGAAAGGAAAGGTAAGGAAPAMPAVDRGVLVHAVLETLDFRRGPAPSAATAAATAARVGVHASDSDVEDVILIVRRFLDSELCRRLASAADVRREERFGFVLEPSGIVVDGVFDVLARDGRRTVIVDYKSDRLAGQDPVGVVAREYRVQRLVYSLAAMKNGAEEVEVIHAFLELPDRPVSVAYVGADAEALERELAGLVDGVLRREFTVSQAPHRALCGGCPGEGGLCSWPLELTRREQVDTLF